MAAKDCNHGRSPDVRGYDNRPECSAWPVGAGWLMAREPAFDVNREPAFDANDLLGRFSDARCFLQCAVKALNAREDACHPGPELVCLRHGLEILRGVYNELDVQMGRGVGRGLGG